ncbi:MAG TPA: cupin domain-containing protein [Pyrinomonadaceae bacterium]|jgi:predicted ChrR family anti-sigma factor
MRHQAVTDEVEYFASHYVLGALSQSEAHAVVEHVAEGCEICTEAIEEFESVVAQLAHAAPEKTPPTDLREKLLARVAAEPPTSNGDAHTHDDQDDQDVRPADVSKAPESFAAPEILTLRAGEGEWQETADEGVFAKVLFVDKERATVTSLVKMSPGARVPMHRHTGVEQCLVLEGDLHAGAVTLLTGDYHCALPGSVHEELHSEHGTLLLIVAPESYEVLAPLSRQS